MVLESNNDTCSTNIDKIKIYPNPSNHWFNIDIENFSSDENISIKIFDTSGKLVKNIHNIKSHNLIDINTLNNGNFIISLSDDNVIIHSQKTTKKD